MPLVDRAFALWGVEREGGDLDAELLASRGHHAVGSGHETGGRGQRYTAGIFEILAGLEDRFLADHAGTPDLLEPALSVGDAPVAGLELDGLTPEVGERDGVGPEKVTVFGGRAIGQKARGHLDLDLASHGSIRCRRRIHGTAFGPICGRFVAYV